MQFSLELASYLEDTLTEEQGRRQIWYQQPKNRGQVVLFEIC